MAIKGDVIATSSSRQIVFPIGGAPRNERVEGTVRNAGTVPIRLGGSNVSVNDDGVTLVAGASAVVHAEPTEVIYAISASASSLEVIEGATR